MKTFNAHLFYDGSIHSKGNADFVANVIYNIDPENFRVVADIMDINYDTVIAQAYKAVNGPDILVVVLDENNKELFRVEGQTPEAICSVMLKEVQARGLI